MTDTPKRPTLAPTELEPSHDSGMMAGDGDTPLTEGDTPTDFDPTPVPPKTKPPINPELPRADDN